MVKNSGGNKAKKQARKTVGGGGVAATQNVRYVAETGEMYAVITTIYGGKTCQVMCDDGISRRCTIRRKFMTARRGENAIAAGTWIMVGLYDWEKRADGSQTCDILEVYSTGEKEKLKQTVSANVLKHIMVVNNMFDGNANGSEFVFSDTLASIDGERQGEEDGGEEDSTDEEDEPVKKNREEESDDVEEFVVIPFVAKPGPVKKQTAAEQLDWLQISVDDI
jgi:translation initiation factor IF-1